MDFKEMFPRANLENIASYIMCGNGYRQEPPVKTYVEKIKEAEEKAEEFLEEQFPNNKDFDRISGYFFDLAAAYQEVYLELGLMLGAKIAWQLSRKLE